MRLRLAIIDQDESYTNRLGDYLNERYNGQLVLSCFSTPEKYKAFATGQKIDLLLVADCFEIDSEMRHRNMAVAYFCENADVRKLRNVAAVCKYQKVELIYRECLGLFAEVDSSGTEYRSTQNQTQMALVLGAAGGNGTSTVAAAYALYLAGLGKKVLYLSLEQHGVLSQFFTGDGNQNLSDLLYAVKSNKSNLDMKLQGIVKTDASGVYFFDSCRTPLDMMGAKPEELCRLLEELCRVDWLDYLVLDLDHSIGEVLLYVLQKANCLALVSDGSPFANQKTQRLFEALSTLEDKGDAHMSRKVGIIHNKFSSKTGQHCQMENVPIWGGFHRYEGATTRQIMEQLAQEKGTFEKLMS